MNKDTNAPHCPKCGGEMVHKNGPGSWLAECFGCGFGYAPRDYAYEEDAIAHARRLVRAELARQMLELRAHSMAGADRKRLWLHQAHDAVAVGYLWLHHNPLRLPGEEPAP